MALLKWLQNRNEPLKNQLGMCCEFVVQSLKKLACSRCCTCTRLHCMSSCNKNPKDTQPYNNAWHPIYLLWIFPRPFPFQKTLVLIGFFPVGICQTDRSLTSWYQGDFRESSSFFGKGWKVELPRRWFKNQTVWLSLWVTILVFQFIWNHIFWDGSCCRRKTLWIGFFDPPRSNIST